MKLTLDLLGAKVVAFELIRDAAREAIEKATRATAAQAESTRIVRAKLFDLEEASSLLARERAQLAHDCDRLTTERDQLKRMVSARDVENTELHATISAQTARLDAGSTAATVADGRLEVIKRAIAETQAPRKYGSGTALDAVLAVLREAAPGEG